ncbi:MAG: glycosyltransferase [Desulfobulbaceae bacterium]|nr:glycosyltransferase [Desulfobulbaceae bacterium]
MSRFLFTTFGSLGDLHPYIAVARNLIERGHETVLVAAEEYRPTVESSGITFESVRPSMAELGDYQTLVTKLFDMRRGPEYLICNLVMPYLRSAHESLLKASEGADLLVSHPLTVTLPLVAQLRKLPWVSTVLSPLSFMSSDDPPVIAGAPWLQKVRTFGPTPYRLLFSLFKLAVRSWETPLRNFRNELGLPPSNRMAMFEGQFSPLCNLALFDPQLAQTQPDWPANTSICGTPIFDGEFQDDGILDDLEQFLNHGEPPIVFALGSSAVWMAGDFWDNAVASVQHLGRRAILITGPTMPNFLPESIKAFPYLPYSKIFPRAAAIVHQAGIGTLSQAMRAGCPQLIVPVAFDQPDNAQRAKALGLGRVLPFRKATTRQLTSELELLLSHSDYAKAARALADELTGVDGAARAGDALIECANSSRVAR